MNDATFQSDGPPGDRNRSLDTFHPQHLDPRSVYIHVPFCQHRCGYCNFSLVAGRDHLIERYLAALQTEIGWLDRRYEIGSLFLGGGTPSHLSPVQLARLGAIIRSRFALAENAEVTAECNPNDVGPDRMNALRDLGVNRISLGAQSLDPGKLERLERSHNAADVHNAVETARRQGAVVSLDLIFASPGETQLQWEQDLQRALQLKPEHVSTYELTYEKGTRFWTAMNRGELRPSDEDLRAEMYAHTITTLNGTGLAQYEVSSFATAGNQCRHNLVYWSGDPYFAFGPGASRFVDGIRETNHQSPMRYFKQVESGMRPVADRERLGCKDAARERLAIGLRKIDGVSNEEFKMRTGRSVDQVLGKLAAELIEHNLLTHDNGCWKLTQRGIMGCDWVASKILSQDGK